MILGAQCIDFHSYSPPSKRTIFLFCQVWILFVRLSLSKPYSNNQELRIKKQNKKNTATNNKSNLQQLTNYFNKKYFNSISAHIELLLFL